jgi:DNA-binding transcriptional ArsR family regulator
MKNLIWYLFAGTRGAETRILIVTSLKDKPMNAHRLAKVLKFDYKTVKHHLRVLLDNQIITAVNKGKYGAVYFVSDSLNQMWNDFGSIWKRFGKK